MAAAAHSAPELQSIDRYQLVSCIGKGGMARVFHARLQRIGGFERDVAVKVLLPEYSSEPEFVEMLLDDARIAGSIGHPCVVQVIDVGREGEQFYLVMEYVDGADLRSLMRAVPEGRLPLTMALFITSEILRGLHAVHTAVDRGGVPRGIIHRDVSPANVLVDRSGAIKLGDFGIARASGRISRTRHGAIKGKLRYMAPEQLGAKTIDHRADLYAVGMVLVELILGDAGCTPKKMTSFGPVFRWTRKMAPGKVPNDIADIFDRAVAEDPQKRYADAAAFRRDVAAALHRRSPGYSAEELARDMRRAQVWARDVALDRTEVATPSGREPPEVVTAPGRDAPFGDDTPESTEAGAFAKSAFANSPGQNARIGQSAEVLPIAFPNSQPQKVAAKSVLTPISSAPPIPIGSAIPKSPSAARRVVAPDATPLVAPLPLPPPPIAPVPAYDAWADVPPAPSALTSLSKFVLRPKGRLLARLKNLSPRAKMIAAGATAALLIAGLAAGVAAAWCSPVVTPPSAVVTASTHPAPPARPATGVLAVEGPAGASVTIGATSYPPAPCQLELPPGDYDVKLRRAKRSARTITRHVTIIPGQQVALRL